MLSLQDIQVRRGARTILDVPALELDPRRFTVILGHNGSGKSTLMKTLARQLTPEQGRVLLHGRELARYGARALAREIAFLPQQLPTASGLTVRELVGLGRFAWRGMLGRWRADDHAAVDAAMRAADVAHYADTLSDTLSGGERQRAWIAMLLAQQAPLMLLDEPTSALDLGHQVELMRLLSTLNRQEGHGVVVILHDVNLAARYADRIVALRGGRVCFDGAPDALMSCERLSALYGVEMTLADAADGRKIAVVA